MRFALLAILAATALACNEQTCQNTCRRFYEEEQCDAAPQGRDRDEVIADCIDACNDALRIPGEAPDANDSRFNPDRIPQPVKPVLTNEKDVGAWMDCVWSIPDEECKDDLITSCARVP